MFCLLKLYFLLFSLLLYISVCHCVSSLLKGSSSRSEPDQQSMEHLPFRVHPKAFKPPIQSSNTKYKESLKKVHPSLRLTSKDFKRTKSFSPEPQIEQKLDGAIVKATKFIQQNDKDYRRSRKQEMVERKAVPTYVANRAHHLQKFRENQKLLETAANQKKAALYFQRKHPKVSHVFDEQSYRNHELYFNRGKKLKEDIENDQKATSTDLVQRSRDMYLKKDVEQKKRYMILQRLANMRNAGNSRAADPVWKITEDHPDYFQRKIEHEENKGKSVDNPDEKGKRKRVGRPISEKSEKRHKLAKGINFPPEMLMYSEK